MLRGVKKGAGTLKRVCVCACVSVCVRACFCGIWIISIVEDEGTRLRR